MSNADDLLFEDLALLIGGVTNITTITQHGLVRDDWAASNKAEVPRVEYNPYRYDVTDGASVYRGSFGITIVADRANNKSFGGGDLRGEGDLWTLEAEVIGALSNYVPTLAGFGASPVQWSSRQRPTLSDDDIVTRRLNFLLRLYPGGTVPLSGDDADITGLDPTVDVENWFVDIQSGAHKDMTGKDSDEETPKTHRPTGRLTVRGRIPSGVNPIFPAHGSKTNVTLRASTDVAFSVVALLQAITWNPSSENASVPQTVTLRFLLTDGSTSIFTGTGTPTGS